MPLVLFLVILIGFVSCPNIPFAIAQSNPIVKENSKDQSRHQVFGCEATGSAFICDRTLGSVKAYQLSADSVDATKLSNDSPTFVEGVKGQALRLDSSHMETLEIPNSAKLDSQEFSVSFWIKVPSTTGDLPYGHIISHVNAEYDAGWYIDESRDPGKSDLSISFSVTRPGGDVISTHGITIPEENFVHLTAVFDQHSLRLYLGDSLAASKEFSGTYNPDPKVPLRVGGSAYDQTDLQLSFTIDDLIILDHAISQPDLLGINPSSEEKIKGLAGEWTFDGVLRDNSENGNDATLTTFLASMVFAPDGRLFFTEKNTGKIRIVKNDILLPKPFASIIDLHVDWEQGLLGIAIDPQFADNHFVYVYYTTEDPTSREIYNKIVRFQDKDSVGSDMRVLLDHIPAGEGFHSGGALAFGTDDKLYVTVGDATEGDPAQDPTSWLGKVLRINRDGSIPSDNPIKNSPVFNIGHRNMFGIAFNKKGFGIVTENGERLYDEINSIQEGGNYGYPTYQPKDTAPEFTSPKSSILPLRSYRITVGPTQAIFYSGDRFPDFTNSFLFGTFTGWIYSADVDQEHGYITQERRIDLNPHVYEPVIGVAQSPRGDLYFGSYTIRKLVSISDEEEVLHTVTINSEGLEVTKLDVEPVSGDVVFTVAPDCSRDPWNLTTFTINLPRTILSNIVSVTDQEGRPLKFDVSPSDESNSNIIKVDLDSTGTIIPSRIVLSKTEFENNNTTPRGSSQSSIGIVGSNYTMAYDVWGARIDSARVDFENASINVKLKNAVFDGNLLLSIPTSLLESKSPEGNALPLDIFADGLRIPSYESSNGDTRNLEICFPASTEELILQGTQVIPEFGLSSIMIILVLSMGLWITLRKALGLDRSLQ